MADGLPWGLELPFITARGRRIWVQPIGQAEMALRASEDRYRSFIEYPSDIVFTLNTERIFTYFSPNSEHFVGRTLAETTGQPFAPWVHPVDIAACF